MTDQANRNGAEAAAPILGAGSRTETAGGPSRVDSDGRPDTQLQAEAEVDTDDLSRASEMVTSTIGSPAFDSPAAAGEAATLSNQTNRAIAEYMLRTDDGEQVDREQFLAEHPEDAAALRQYFAGFDAIHTQLLETRRCQIQSAGDVRQMADRTGAVAELDVGGRQLSGLAAVDPVPVPALPRCHLAAFH